MNAPRYLYAASAETTLRIEGEPIIQGCARDLLDNREALNTARVTGIIAARRAADYLALARHVELGAVEIDFHWRDDALIITTHCEGFSRANLGSRALLAASVCAVTLIDMLPEYAEQIVLDGARIIAQKGGPQQFAYDFDPPLRAAILVTSDAVMDGHKEDRAGAIVRDELEKIVLFGVQLVEERIIGDDATEIADTLQAWVDEGVDLVLTVGGTGLVPTDVTVETVGAMLERPIPGIMEAARAYGQSLTPVAFMSRGVAGLIGETLVITLPGSRGGARETCEALFPSVLHVFLTLRRSRALG